MATRVSPGVWELQGERVTMPAEVREATMTASLFTCRPSEARRAVAAAGYEPVTVLGRALTMLIAVRYDEGDLGAYDELGLVVIVHGPDGEPAQWIAELPVTQGFTLEAGRDIWGLPKWLAETDFRFGRRRTQLHLSEDGQHVLSGVLRTGGIPVPGRWTSEMAVLSSGPHLKSGHPTLAIGDMAVTGVRWRPGGAHLVLGDHRMARRARALGVGGTAICTVRATHLVLSLGDPRPLEHDGSSTQP